MIQSEYMMSSVPDNVPLSFSNAQIKEMFVDTLGYKKTDQTTVVGAALCAGVVGATFRLGCCALKMVDALGKACDDCAMIPE